MKVAVRVVLLVGIALGGVAGWTQIAAAPAVDTDKQIAAMKAKLDDWPQLDRYKAANATLGSVAPGEDRV
ncbi:MAG TPA: capsular biosynthesis protein, partial [Edaphobacter sp.]